MIKIQTLGSSSKGNCYALRSGGRSLLVECGLPWKHTQRALNFETSNLDGCLCTHCHQDHFKSFQEFMKASVDVYAHADTWFSVQDKMPRNYGHRAISFEHSQEITIGDYWRVFPFPSVHDVTCSGFVIREPGNGDRICFITDTAYCRYKFDKITIFMIEANYSEAILAANVEAGHIEPSRAKRVRKNHFSIERVIEFIKANDFSHCREVRLLHLSDGNSNEDLFKRMVQEATGIPTYVEEE